MQNNFNRLNWLEAENHLPYQDQERIIDHK